MLTGYQIETVAFMDENGEFLHPDCAVKAYNAIAVGKAERGLTTGSGLRALSRYSLGEIESEDAWERGEERVREFLYHHPAIAESFASAEGDGVGPRWKLVSRVVERMEYRTECAGCGEVLDA